MRVAHVVSTRNPENIQGNERHVVYLAGTQRARGMNSVAVTNQSGLFFDLCKQEGIPAFAVDDMSLNGEASPGSAAFMQGIAARLIEFSPEIIHCHDQLSASAAVLAADVIKAPCAVTLHVGMKPRIYNLIIAKKLTAIVVFRSEFEALRKAGMANIDFHYVPNGTRAVSGARQREQDASAGPNLMLVGNLEFRKGIDLAILAMVELRRRRGAGCPVLLVYTNS